MNSRENGSFPKAGRVNEVCREWVVREDGALAYKLQNEEFTHHLSNNKHRNQQLRQDFPCALTEQLKEKEEAEQARQMYLKMIAEQEEKDAQIAAQLNEKIRREEEKKRHKIEQKDLLLAKSIQVQDPKRMKNRIIENENHSSSAYNNLNRTNFSEHSDISNNAIYINQNINKQKSRHQLTEQDLYRMNQKTSYQITDLDLQNLNQLHDQVFKTQNNQKISNQAKHPSSSQNKNTLYLQEKDLYKTPTNQNTSYQITDLDSKNPLHDNKIINNQILDFQNKNQQNLFRLDQKLSNQINSNFQNYRMEEHDKIRNNQRAYQITDLDSQNFIKENISDIRNDQKYESVTRNLNYRIPESQMNYQEVVFTNKLKTPKNQNEIFVNQEQLASSVEYLDTFRDHHRSYQKSRHGELMPLPNEKSLAEQKHSYENIKINSLELRHPYENAPLTQPRQNKVMPYQNVPYNIEISKKSALPSMMPSMDQVPDLSDRINNISLINENGEEIFDEVQLKLLQEQKDAELAKKLQEQECIQGQELSQEEKDRLLAIEAQDKELARILQQKEKQRLKRAKERAKQKALAKKQQEERQAFEFDDSYSNPLDCLKENPKIQINGTQRVLDEDEVQYSYPVQDEDGNSTQMRRPNNLDLSSSSRKSRNDDSLLDEHSPRHHEMSTTSPNKLKNIAMAIDPTYSRRSSGAILTTSQDSGYSPSPTTPMYNQGIIELEDNSPVPPYMPIQGQRRTSSLEKKSKRNKAIDGCKQQ